MPQGNVEYPPNVFGSREREYRHPLIDEAVSVTRVEKDKILSVYTWDGNKPKGPSFKQKEKKKEPDEDSKHPSPPEGVICLDKADLPSNFTTRVTLPSLLFMKKFNQAIWP